MTLQTTMLSSDVRHSKRQLASDNEWAAVRTPEICWNDQIVRAVCIIACDRKCWLAPSLGQSSGSVGNINSKESRPTGTSLEATLDLLEQANSNISNDA